MVEEVVVVVEGEEVLEVVAEVVVSEEVAAEEWEVAEVRNIVRKYFIFFILLKVFFYLDCWMIRKSFFLFKFF